MHWLTATAIPNCNYIIRMAPEKSGAILRILGKKWLVEDPAPWYNQPKEIRILEKGGWGREERKLVESFL